jgi:CHAD domain-containing protein
MIEREAKFQVDEGFELPDLNGVIADATADEPAERTVEDTYYDTEDLRLLRWGCTLRNRKRKGWTIKLPRGVTRSALVRNEVTVRGRAGQPPVGATDLVGPLTRGRPLEVIASLITRRTTRTWTDGNGGVLVELAEDSTTSSTPDGTVTAFHQLEVELMPGVDITVLDGFIDTLVAAGARPDPAGLKVRKALGEPELGPPDVVLHPLSDEPSARDVIGRAVTSSVLQLLTELPAAVLGEDPEGVHQARVATRRLRSDLRTFRRLLDPAWVDSLQDGLRDLTRRLGAVRDIDVLSELFRQMVEDRPRIDPDGGAAIGALLEQRRHHHLDALRDHLRLGSTHQFLDRLIGAAADPVTAENADEPAVDELPPLVARRWRKLARTVQALGPAPAADELHRVRILTKRTRYATEAVAPAFGKAPRRMSRALARMQDDLGNRNDLAVAEHWLIDHAEQLPPAGAFAAGRLAEVLATDPGDTGGDWVDSFERASRPKNRSWFS